MTYYLYSTIGVLVSSLLYYFYIYRSYEIIILDTKYGTLKGFKGISRDGRIYNSFTSIPYAKPPVGELRFQPPIEINEKWNGIKDFTIEPPLCLQNDFIWKKIIGQEDCLYLNVFTPKIPKKKEDNLLLPVMVFIHGGYFTFGGIDVYHPDYFMDEDVVLVTINYRLGPFGFLSTGDDIVSGNMGLKDQVMALRWVQSTIKDFGGDPNLVTLFGESAGGGSVHFHMFSALSKGLFHRAISQSGTSLCPWADVEKDTKAQAKELGESLKCPTRSSEELINCLKLIDAIKITEIQGKELRKEKSLFGPEIIYGPTLEKGKEMSKAFLTTSTRKLYEQGKVLNLVPWISGVNKDEGCWFSSVLIHDEETMDKLYNNWNTLISKPLIYYNKNSNVVAKKILKYYFGDKPKPFSIKNYQNFSDMFSGRCFFTCHGQSIRLHSKFSPTYSYYFTYKSSNSLGFIAGESKGKYYFVSIELLIAKLKHFIYTQILNWNVHDYGVCHADELQYMFYTLPFSGIYKSSPYYKFSKSFIKLWVHFAKNGYPGKYNGIEWEKLQPNQLPKYMNIGKIPKMIHEPFTSHLKFWESLDLTPK